jgi:hypothetical protein
VIGSSRLRRAGTWALLAAVLAAAAMPHRHYGLAEEGAGERPSQSVLTNHNPHSAAFHWHAVLKTLQDEPCWACHWNRLFGVRSADALSPVLLPGRRLAQLPPRSALSVARFTHLSRGPPSRVEIS